MKKQNKHITFKAQGLLLALLIFIAFGAKEFHHMMEHSHAAIEICDAKAGDLHLHAYENLAHDCSLCDFTFSLFELPLSCFHLNELAALFFKRDFSYLSFNLSRSYLFQSLRAPPCLVVC